MQSHAADIPEEYQSLRVAPSEFDPRAFLKKYLASEGYFYVSDYAQKDYEERREHQDEQLQQLVLDHLSVFVQCKDAIEDVYNSDKQLFTGAAMRDIVEVFSQFREQMIEPLLQPILSMDSETNHLRHIQGIAARNAAVLNLPFHALRSALGCDFDECVQHLKSVVSFLDSSKFQRYSVMKISARNHSGGGSSILSGGGGGGDRSFSTDMFGQLDDTASNTSAGMDTPTGAAGAGGITTATTMSGGGGGGGSSFSSSLFTSTTLQPFEVVHRLFASWISAAEDTAYFALFLARHELAGSFTLLSQQRQEQLQAMFGSFTNNVTGLSVSSRNGSSRNNNNTNWSSKKSSSSSLPGPGAAGGSGGVRLVELEDLLFQIIRLLDVLSMIRLERYRLLGPRAVEVADAARQANCTTTKSFATLSVAPPPSSSSSPAASTTTTTMAAKKKVVIETGGEKQQQVDENENNNNNPNNISNYNNNHNNRSNNSMNKPNSSSFSQQQSRSAPSPASTIPPPPTSSSSSPSSPTSSTNAFLQYTSREIGIAKYLAAVLATSVKSSTALSCSTSQATTGQGQAQSSSSSLLLDQDAILPTPQEVLDQAKLFTRIFGDPRPQHPILVYCHMFERSIHLNVSSSINRLELEVRSVEVKAEQEELNISSTKSSSFLSLSSSWWAQFVPRNISNLRLVSVAPDHFQQMKGAAAVGGKNSSFCVDATNNNNNNNNNFDEQQQQQAQKRIPNRIAILAKSLLMLREEGLSSSSSSAIDKQLSEGQEDDDDHQDEQDELQHKTTNKSNDTSRATAEDNAFGRKINKSKHASSSQSSSKRTSPKPLSLCAAVMKRFKEPRHVPSTEKGSSSSASKNKNYTRNSNNNNNNDDDNNNKNSKYDFYQETTNWLEGKSDDDAIWFADHCEQNLQTFRAVLACLAPPSNSPATAVGSMSSIGGESSDPNNNININNSSSTSNNSNNKSKSSSAASSSSSSSSKISSSKYQSTSSRHKSMNVIAANLTSLIRDSLRGVSSAWKRIAPLLRAGSLFREEMEWAVRAGIETSNKKDSATTAASGKNKRKSTMSSPSKKAGENFDDLLSVTFTNEQHLLPLLDGEDERNNNNNNGDEGNDDENEPDVDDFLSSAAMLRRLFSTTMMNSFNLSVPQRTIEKLQETCSGFNANDDNSQTFSSLDRQQNQKSSEAHEVDEEEKLGSTAAFFHQPKYSVPSASASANKQNASSCAGSVNKTNKATTLLIAASRLEMTHWLRTFGKFASALFRELLLADLQGFFCSLASFKFCGVAAGTNSSNSNNTVNKGKATTTTAAPTVQDSSSSSSLSSSASQSTAIEAEVATTIRRWSHIINELVGDITEMQRTISLECDLPKNQDPFHESNVVQTSLLMPITTSFAEGVRRIFCIARHEIWAPKSPSWVLKEMENMSGGSSSSSAFFSSPSSDGGAAMPNSYGNSGWRGSPSSISGSMGGNLAAVSSSSSSSSSSSAGSSSFSEMMESFVARSRHSLTNRFGSSCSNINSNNTNTNNNNNNSNNNNSNTNCSEFTISAVETTSKILTICAPLLRAVKKFDAVLCDLIGGVVLDQIFILQRRASCAVLLESTCHPAALDAECASWLSFLSCAPFSSGSGVADSEMRVEILRAFGGGSGFADSSSSSSGINNNNSNSSLRAMSNVNISIHSNNNNQQQSLTGNTASSTSAKAKNNDQQQQQQQQEQQPQSTIFDYLSTSSTSKRLRRHHTSSSSDGNSGGNSNTNSTANDLLSRTISKQLLGFVRCTILEQCVADATALVQTALPLVIADNVAATLSFKSTTITDSRLTKSSSTTSWLLQFFLHRDDGRNASTIDALLSERRSKFLSDTPACACLLGGRGGESSCSSSSTASPSSSPVQKVYRIASSCIQRLASKATVSALDAWFSLGIARTTFNIETALKYDDEGDNEDEDEDDDEEKQKQKHSHCDEREKDKRLLGSVLAVSLSASMLSQYYSSLTSSTSSSSTSPPAASQQQQQQKGAIKSRSNNNTNNNNKNTKKQLQQQIQPIVSFSQYATTSTRGVSASSVDLFPFLVENLICSLRWKKRCDIYYSSSRFFPYSDGKNNKNNYSSCPFSSSLSCWEAVITPALQWLVHYEKVLLAVDWEQQQRQEEQRNSSSFSSSLPPSATSSSLHWQKSCFFRFASQLYHLIDQHFITSLSSSSSSPSLTEQMKRKQSEWLSCLQNLLSAASVSSSSSSSSLSPSLSSLSSSLSLSCCSYSALLNTLSTTTSATSSYYSTTSATRFSGSENKNILPPETLDHFLAKDAPIEFQAWKKDRGLPTDEVDDDDDDDGKKANRNQGTISNTDGRFFAMLAATNKDNYSDIKQSQPYVESWWAADSRGAERREMRLLERRGARVASATGLLNQTAFHAPSGSASPTIVVGGAGRGGAGKRLFSRAGVGTGAGGEEDADAEDDGGGDQQGEAAGGGRKRRVLKKKRTSFFTKKADEANQNADAAISSVINQRQLLSTTQQQQQQQLAAGIVNSSQQQQQQAGTSILSSRLSSLANFSSNNNNNNNNNRTNSSAAFAPTQIKASDDLTAGAPLGLSRLQGLLSSNRNDTNILSVTPTLTATSAAPTAARGGGASAGGALFARKRHNQ